MEKRISILKCWAFVYHVFSPNLFSCIIVSIVGRLRDREVACSTSDRQGSNFESCVWRTVSSQSSHHPQKVLLAQFSLYVHKGGLKPDSFDLVVSLCKISHFRKSSFCSFFKVNESINESINESMNQ